MIEFRKRELFLYLMSDLNSYFAFYNTENSKVRNITPYFNQCTIITIFAQ